MEPDCIFCKIIDGTAAADVVATGAGWIAFTPLNPVVVGHTLVVPKVHVEDFMQYPDVTGEVFSGAAELAADLELESANLITSAGEAATQSVFHLHVHVIPRAVNDGLVLPWYSGRGKR